MITVGVSLKTYFSHARTLSWAAEVGDIARRHPAVRSGAVTLFVAPTFPALVPVRDLLEGSGVQLAAQDLSWADAGAFTGEVPGAELREIGVDLVEIGHAERRSLFHEDDATIAGKVHAAFRNHLRPLVCVGEPDRASPHELGRHAAPQAPQRAGTGSRGPNPTEAVAAVTAQLDRAVSTAVADGLAGPLTVAYEPVWAIGAPAPAPDDHIVAVLAGIEQHLATRPELHGSTVLYGGSAGPGLLTRGRGRIGGLFLGRFAHDPAAVEAILDEVAALN
ncbi:triose-phosphate isomerase family protein [Curtobacterium flaccumfaciens]|uniref:triose-phosphate isomerase family protein n=1 Tax=Curtobacterium flaccumfaciens TaxID=2035 RepID=UPI001ADCBE2D|nr:triose-phosphate isomerase family protein [Curtobacterium flaccumfaciens]MBO9038393.1 triosephosphate isomerase [Curtobacterium flaccumfaciens pv. flaccumfaciens]